MDGQKTALEAARGKYLGLMTRFITACFLLSVFLISCKKDPDPDLIPTAAGNECWSHVKEASAMETAC
jgi:hypothetical protein